MPAPKRLAIFSDAKTLLTPQATYHAFLARDENGAVWLAIREKPLDTPVNSWTTACHVKFDGRSAALQTSDGFVENIFGITPSHFRISMKPDGIRVTLSSVIDGVLHSRDLVKPLTRRDFLPYQPCPLFLAGAAKGMTL